MTFVSTTTKTTTERQHQYKALLRTLDKKLPREARFYL